MPHIFHREDYSIALPKGSAVRESINGGLLEKIHGHEWQDILHQYLGGSFDLGYRDEEIPNDLETNLNEIISPFYRTLSANYAHLTPKEIQVADLVKRGKTTKEIGEIMNSSARAIEFHRINIRKKLGLANQKTNLRFYLLTLH